MILKKLIAGTLSILICSSEVTSTNVVDLINNNTKQGSSNSVSNENDYELKSSNSLGNYITAIAEANNNGSSESDNSEKNFTISNLDFDDKTGKILIQSTQTSNCKAVVSFIDDITCKNVLEKVIDVNEGNSTISEATVNTLSLPEFYLVKAQLVDESGNVLSSVFTFNKYTEEMQEILAADIHDFNEDYVVSFDESEDTNFIVLNEQTVIIESSETENTLVSADYDNNVYVFENADEDIKSLESGEYLYVQPNENDIIAVSVEDVDFNDNQVTVTGDSENIDNMFDFIKFESVTENDEITYDTSICDEDIEYSEGSLEKTGKLCFNLQKLNNKLASFSGSTSQSFSYSHEFETANDCISVEPSLKFELKQEFNFYKKWSYINISFNLDNSLSLALSVKASLPEGYEIEKDIAKATIPTGIPGVAIQSTVKLCLEIEGSFSVEYTTTTSRGFIYDSDIGYEPVEKDCTDNNKISAKAQGTVFAGIKLSVAAVLIDEKIASFGIEAKIGIEITGELANTVEVSGEAISSSGTVLCCYDTSKDTQHACDTCLKGEINFVASGGIKLSVLTHDFELTLASLSVKITDWYLSIDNKASGMSLINGMLPATWLYTAKNTKFGFGTCPNLAYKTTFNISHKIDEDQSVDLSKEYILIDGQVKVPMTSNGNVSVYCKNGSHKYQIFLNDEKEIKSGIFNINNATKKLTINLSFSSGGYGGIVSNDSNGRIITLPAASTNSVNRNIKPTKVTTASGMKILESGSLGDNITYMLYNDGSLFINGYGETYDFSGSPFNNPKNVREVIFENRDEKNNKVITSIGNNIFTYCTNLDVVYWSNYIKKIGDSAFNGCSNLKYFRYSGQNDKTTNFKFPNNLVSIGNYAFSGCKGLTSITVSGTVKTIGNYAFNGCTSLKTAVIKNGVESIGERTFSDCTALESLTLPYAGLSIENVKNNTYPLSTNLFNYWVPEGTYSATGNSYYGVPKTLTSITITGGTRIPNSAFYGMSGLKTINLPNTVTNIGSNALYGCSSMTGIKLPNSLTTIEDSAFNNCSSLKFENIIIPSTLTSIGNYAFANCNGFTKLTVPGTIKTIGNYAFSGCKGLTSVTVSGTVKTIGNYAFNGCTLLKTAVIKNGVESIGERTFSDCTALESLTLPYAGLSIENVKNNTYPLSTNLFNYWVPEGTYSATGNSYYGVPKTLTSITITGGTRIPNSAFYGMSGLKTINLPNTVTNIGSNALYGCSSMTGIKLPNSLTTIEDSAFNNCSSLKFENIIIPSTLTSIGNYAFANCNGFTKLTVPGTIKTIGNYAFSGCKGLTSVTVSGTVKTIGNYAFNGCTLLKTAVIKNGVESIGERTFSDCTALESLTLPYAGLSIENVKNNTYPLSTNLFNYWVPEGTYSATGNSYYGVPKTLTSITITGGTRIPNSAFYGMSGLKTINLPNTVTNIGSNALYGCSSMTGIKLPNSLTTIEDSAFNNCSSLKFENIIIPSTLTSIGNYAFANCNGFTKLTVPGTIKTIGNYAFSGCKGLTSVTVSGTVKTIGNYAFNGCTLLKTAVIKNGVESIGERTFSDCTALESLTLPYAGLSIENVKNNTYPLSTNLFNYWVPEGTYSATGNSYYGVPKTLTSITITGGTRIPNSAFYGMSSLKTINLPNTITIIGDYASCGCIGLRNLYVDKTSKEWEKVNIGIFNDAIYVVNKTFNSISIKSQPKSVVADVNSTAEFTISVSGNKITYQWQYSKDNGKTWINCSNASSKTNTLNLVAAANRNNYLCRCVIKDANGFTAVSKAATLTIKTKLEITKQPESVMAEINKTAEFKVQATGDNLKYQWQYSKDNGGNWINSSNPSSTTDTFNLVAAANRNNFLVRCVITDEYGEIIESDSAVLTIKTKLEIIKQPESVTAEVNKTAEFTVEATGDNIKYQWQYSRDNGKSWINSSNTSSITDTFNLVAAANRNNFLVRCVITDEYGEIIESDSAVLTIKTKLEIIKQPESVTAEVNKTAEFTVGATGDNLKYQWQYSKNNGENWINSSNPSSTTDTFNLVAAANRNNFLVRCVITDEYGETIESDSTILTIEK